MTDDLQDLDGVGPAREEKLNDAGYETYADLAEADYEDLSEELDRLPEDSALELVVQAQNSADLQEAEVVESEEVEDESEFDLVEEDEPEEEVEETDEEDESEDEAGEDEVETFDVELSFSDPKEYDTFFHTVIEERSTAHRTNRAGAEIYETILSELRDASVEEGVTVELTASSLNDLHNAVIEQRIDYQGDNLIDYMDAIKQIENQIDEQRREYLF